MAEDHDISQMRQDDHDLLIELHTIIKQVRVDIKDLKDNYAARLDVVERRKVWIEDFLTHKSETAATLGVHEDRIVALEKSAERRKGSWSTLQVLGTVFAFIVGSLLTYLAIK